MTGTASEYLSARQIADELGLGIRTVRHLFVLGQRGDPRGIPGNRVGREWRTTRQALDAWLVRPADHRG